MAAAAQGPPTLVVVVFVLVSVFVLATVAVMIVSGERRFRGEPHDAPAGGATGSPRAGSDVESEKDGDDVADVE